MAEPSQEPNVPASTTPTSVKWAYSWNCPLACATARNAAGGTTISLGTGKMDDSMAMSPMMPR